MKTPAPNLVNTAIQRAIDNGKKRALFFAIVSAFCILHSASSWAQGALTPPAAPGPTMKSLDQIEARTPISVAPFTITASGSYYLTTNVTVSSGDAITISANNVTLDLNGFTISSTRPVANADIAIVLNGARTNISIYNGHISSGVTNSAAGVFGGSGFSYGITYSTLPPFNVRVKDVSVSGVLFFGINLNIENSTLVESCTVVGAGNWGIYADNISDSTAVNCGTVGIYGTTAHNCKGIGVGSGIGVNCRAADNCYGESFSGDGLSAYTANNCYGLSSGGNGLFAHVANNCQGSGAGTGYGLSADTANNCEGQAGIGDGLDTTIANSCYGLSSSGEGLFAFVATSCNGISTSGTGLYTATANNCYGKSSSGIGLAAHIASGCIGESTSGTALIADHNVNSFQ
jgi:hypothetical protein